MVRAGRHVLSGEPHANRRCAPVLFQKVPVVFGDPRVLFGKPPVVLRKPPVVPSNLSVVFAGPHVVLGIPPVLFPEPREGSAEVRVVLPRPHAVSGGVREERRGSGVFVLKCHASIATSCSRVLKVAGVESVRSICREANDDMSEATSAKKRSRPAKEKGEESTKPSTPLGAGANGRKPKALKPEKDKSLETWIWDAACSIRGAKDAPKYKDYILPLIFTKRLCDVFDDELDRIAAEVGSREKAFRLVKADKKLVRFYLPLEPKEPNDPVWSVIRTLSDKIGEELTTHLRGIAKANPLLQGIIDRVDFNATTHGQRDLADDRLSNLIEAVSTKRLGLKDVEADIIGKSYEYLIRKFAEGGGQSAGEFYTPGEVAEIMARALECEPGMEVYDPCCGSGGLLIKCELALNERMKEGGTVSTEGGLSSPPHTPGRTGMSAIPSKYAPLQLHGQEYVPETWAMANMNMIIHDIWPIEIGDTFKNPKFKEGGRLQTFDRVVANPMWNQDWFTEADYANDEWDRFPSGAGFPGKASAVVVGACPSSNAYGADLILRSPKRMPI